MVNVAIYMESGHLIGVFVSHAEAVQLMQGWKDGILKDKVAGKCLSTGVDWVIRVDKIVAIHTTNATPQQGQQVLQPQRKVVGSPWNQGMSGG